MSASSTPVRTRTSLSTTSTTCARKTSTIRCPMKPSKSKNSPAPPAKSLPPPKANFWDDDDEAPIGVPIKQIKSLFDDVDLGSGPVKPLKAAQKPEIAKEPAHKPASSDKVLPELQCPGGYFAIGRPTGVRLLILDRAGSDWSELLCYNYEMHVTMHVKRVDLVPKDAVDEAIRFIDSKLRQ